ncbi:MAG: ATP-binding protein [Chloroflexi bacterium]|nr:ATP-binding protein [Chloroflexota bacterium]
MSVKKLAETITYEKHTDEMMRQCNADALRMFDEAGMAEEASRARRQEVGGECPLCQTAYAKEHMQNRFADFWWFKPGCRCEETRDERYEHERRLRDKLELAGIPRLYIDVNVEKWDHGVEGKTNEAFNIVYRYAAEREYMKQGLVLYGSQGTGKTRSAAAILRHATESGLRVRFQPMAEIVAKFTDREQGRRFAEALIEHDIVLFDDLEKLSPDNIWVQQQIFAIFDGLITRKKTILTTSNLPDYPAFEAKFGKVIMSRIIGACTFVEFVGTDYRIRRAEMQRLNREAREKGGAHGDSKKETQG